MNAYWFLQVTAAPALPTIPYFTHLVILSLIMIATGLLGGYSGYLIEKVRVIAPDIPPGAEETDPIANAEKKAAELRVKREKTYFLITGLCAALLIPLFLSTISSHLMADAQKDPVNYFVFGGFCLLVAIFSKQFLTSLSDKIIQKATEKAAQKAEEVSNKNFDTNKVQFLDKIETTDKKITQSNTTNDVINDLTTLEKQANNDQNPKQLRLSDATGLLDRALQTNDEKFTAQIFDRLTILFFNKRLYDEMEAMKDKYKDLIKFLPGTWANLAIANMNNYNTTKDGKYKLTAENEINESLKLLPDYGVPYALRIYLLLIDYHFSAQDSDAAKQLQIKNVLDIILRSPKITLTEAYNYFMLNESNEFTVYNNLLRSLFNDQWNVLEETGKQMATSDIKQS